MEYEPRPKPIGICKCGHRYTDHSFEDNPGNWFQRNIVLFWIIGERKECRECMCEQYEQVKVIDEKTGIEIPPNRSDKQ